MDSGRSGNKNPRPSSIYQHGDGMTTKASQSAKKDENETFGLDVALASPSIQATKQNKKEGKTKRESNT